MTLSPNRLRECKEEWEKLTKIDDSVVVRKAVQTAGEHWYYFNPVRLYEIAASIGFNLMHISDASGHLVRSELDTQIGARWAVLRKPGQAVRQPER